MTITEATGWLATALFFVSYFPQLIRTFKLKSVDDISVSMWYILMVAYTSLLIHGTGIGSNPIVINSLLGMSCVSVMLLMYYQFRDPRKEKIRKEVRDFIKDVRRKFNG